MANDPLMYLHDLFAKSVQDMPPEAAQFLLAVKVGADDQDRAQELADKNRESTITESELAELDAYIGGTAFLSWLKSNARRALRDKDPSSGSANPADEMETHRIPARAAS